MIHKIEPKHVCLTERKTTTTTKHWRCAVHQTTTKKDGINIDSQRKLVGKKEVGIFVENKHSPHFWRKSYTQMWQ